MWPYIILIPAVYLAALLDTTLGPALDLGPAAPDWLVLVALVWSLTVTGPRGHLATGAVGLVSDVLSPGRLGAGLACFALVGYGLPRLRSHSGARQPQTLALWALPAATLLALGPAVVRRAWGELEVSWLTIVFGGLSVGAYTAGAALPILLVVAWVRRARRRRQW
jgi:rod shape-determining protein MreD